MREVPVPAIVGVYPISGEWKSVVFEPTNPIEAIIGGETIIVKAPNETRAKEQAIKRYKRKIRNLRKRRR